MKRIIRRIICAVMLLCVFLVNPIHCSALSPFDEQMVRHIAKEEAKNVVDSVIYNIMGPEVGPMSVGAYNWANKRADESLNSAVGQLLPRIEALEKSSGASSQDISNLNNKVDDTNNKIDQNSEKVDNVQKSIDDLNKKSDNSDGSTVTGVRKVLIAFIELANKIWNSIGMIFYGASFGENIGLLEYFNFQIDINSYVNSNVYTVMKTLAYSLVLLFFSVNMIETTIKYESVSLKGFIVMTIRIVIAKKLIDNCPKICTSIIKIVRDTIGQMWETKEVDLSDVMGKDTILDKILNVGQSKLPFVGEIVDAILVLVAAVPIILMSLSAFIVGAIILVKILLWSVDMVILVSVSPAFVACWSSDVTKQYFKNFIVTFIQASLQLLYMAIVFFLFKTFLATTVPDGDNMVIYMVRFVPNLIVMIAMAIMMIKPPKFLTNMLR